MPLEDYKDIVGTCASITTIGQFFSGVFICKDIVKKGSTENVADTPFIGGIAVSLLMYVYAKILNDPAMVSVNIAGITLNVCYLLCYYLYTHDQKSVLKHTWNAFLICAVFVAYAWWEDPDLIEHRFGIIVTVLLLLLIGSPLFSLGEIIRSKSSASLPFPLILSGTVVSAEWLLYGIIIKNHFIQLQNAVALVLSAIQLSLFVIYPSKPKEKEEKKKD
ncbi:sugar transporter SWEET1-like [Schistocerca cancellata]|uniref:sugar transporter SWEET1-like n=1 Tax=Schistocerca cancellata TaxID=274614 RepID=UPI002118EF71|nr:sugar transporter SWEET1-like [Schistocerca cancellata]